MRFGEQRSLRGRYGAPERFLFRAMGVADPAHYLHALYFRQALGALPERAPAGILDAGCGRGDFTFYLARRFPGARVLGVDVDEAAVARNRETARELGLVNVCFEVEDLTAMDRTDEFDLVVSVDVLEHIEEQQRALEAIAASLRPRGAAFLHVPTVRERPVPLHGRLSAFRAWGEDEHVAEEKRADEFAGAVRRAGLAVQQVRRTFGYWTGEMATSLFALGFPNTPRDRLFQGAMAPLCRLLALLDTLGLEETRYAVAVVASKPARA